MTIDRIRLSLLQNGLHSIHHAVEHLSGAITEAEAHDAEAYDPESGSVAIPTNDGSSAWYDGDPYIRLPEAYGIKFSILHLIHGVELLVKAYHERMVPGSTAEPGKSGRTISMRAATKMLVALRPGLLDPDHLDLVMRAGDFRNQIEHAEFDISWSAASRLALDFLSVANYLAHALHDVSLAQQFDFDPYREEGNPAGKAIGELLSERSVITETMVQRLASEWAAQRPLERLVRCLVCGARGISIEMNRCVACGSFGDAEIDVLMDELDDATSRVLELRRQAGILPPFGQTESNSGVGQTTNIRVRRVIMTSGGEFPDSGGGFSFAPAGVKGHRFTLRDDNSQHYHRSVPMTESPYDVALSWRADAHTPIHPIGTFRLDLRLLLLACYVRAERPSDDTEVRIRFFRAEDGSIYLQSRLDAPGLRVARTPI